MELKADLKKTDTRVIPEDWDVKSIKGITTDMLQGVNTAIDIPEYVESGYPMLKANNIIDGEVRFFTSDHISAKTYHGYNERFKIKKGDFLFSNIGARLGTGSLMKTNIECSFAWNVMRIIPNQKIVKPEFLGCIMNSPALFKEIKKNESGSGMGFIPKNVLQTLTFPIPKSLAEQTVIATALSDADSLIISLEKLIAKKRNIKQGAMQKLLQPKEGWEVKSLGEVAPLQRGFDLPNKYLKNGEYPVVYSNGIGNFHNQYQVKAPGIITGRSGTIGKVTFIEKDYWPHNTSLWVTDFKGNNPKYVYYLFLHIKLDRLASGSGVPTLNRNDVHDYIINIPSMEEQNTIATALTDMDAEIAALETKLDKYRNVKLGMMQNLLTGKIRLV